jgi:cold shock CspA family protein
MSSARFHGELVFWRQEGSFGFIRPDDATKDLFVNMYEMRRASREMPQVGDRFSFELGHDDRGRERAVDLRPDGVDAAAERVFKHEPVRP